MSRFVNFLLVLGGAIPALLGSSIICALLPDNPITAVVLSGVWGVIAGSLTAVVVFNRQTRY